MLLLKETIQYLDTKTNALLFIPDLEVPFSKTFAVFTHGYTSDKSSIFTWATRLSEVGIPTVIFDLPGHYLGNYSEVTSFESFKSEAPKLFVTAYKSLRQNYLEHFPLNESLIDEYDLRLVLGGHSLGALLSLKALELEEFKNLKKLSISVGLGMAPIKHIHLFDTPFYKSTLKIREQLVSPELRSENVFPWIKEEKEKLNLKDQRIHLITGADDVVVGDDGMERLRDLLEKNNHVTLEKPTKLPHHEPELAASHIKKFLKDIKWFE